MTNESRSMNVDSMTSDPCGRLDRYSSLPLFRLLAADRGTGSGGTESVGLRAYVPGDDYRDVDWQLCARRNQLLTRTCDGPLDGPRYFLLDCSASMALGRPSKFEAARRLASVLGCAALVAGCAIDVIPFAASPHTEGLRLCGKNQVLRLRRRLDSLTLDAAPTDLGRTAAVLAGRYQAPGPVVIISDFMDPGGFQRPLALLHHRGYSPRIVQVYAPEEADPGALGDVGLCDVESQQAVSVTLSPRIVARYRQLFAEFLASVRQCAIRHGWPYVRWPSSQILSARGDWKR
jgi:uncharacterized protein (DUF58 family)